ncbi:acyl-CoA dehydrogenase [Lyophyllum atratum]|nr:acyl-CoA dehydrogenase [Lyophyllum atratum]
MSSKQFTKEEVAKHNKNGDLWIVVDSKVYDLSKFAAMHPGGLSVLLDEEVAGQDATNLFFGLHRYEVLLKPQYSRLQIGVVAGEEQQIFPRALGALSKVPYAEPTWLTQGYHSPYYKDHHRRFQAAFRKFVEEVLLPDAQLREEDGKRPSQSVFDEMAKQNLIAMRLGPGKHLKGRVLMGGIVKPEEFDYFYELIMAQEVARLNARGYYDGSGGGTYIGLPPVMNFGKGPIREKVMEDVFSGKKFICLAISEAFAGSDVAGLKCHAKRIKDRKNGWIVTGTKKWITNATFSDYFTVGCRTDDGGMVVLLIERGEGVETKTIKTSYSTAAGTGYITFENVFVPYENTLGTDNGGLQVILSNFNHERWGMACGSVGAQRYIVEECLKWATQRQVFGKPLTSQAVIRSKLAAMIARVESAQNWIENVTYQMTHMSYKEQASHLAGQIAFVKKYCTETAQETARDAVQIFGGRGITKTGMGRYIEHYHRTVPFDAILGGAEDVLGDLGVRQALRKMPKNARL